VASQSARSVQMRASAMFVLFEYESFSLTLR